MPQSKETQCKSKRFNGIIPQFRWQNGLWVEFVFNEKMDIGLVDGLVDVQKI